MDEYYLDVIREQAAEFGAGYAGKYDEYVSYDQIVVESRELDESEETAEYTQTMHDIAEMRAAVATVPSYCERPQTDADDRFVSRRARLAVDTCEHGTSLSLCPACSDLA